MESLKNISSLEIPTNRIFYDNKTNVLSIEILDFMFVGTYKKSTRITKVLDDIFSSFKEIQLNRNEIYFIDFVTNIKIPETTKLKNLKVSEKKKKEIKEEKPEETKKKPKKKLKVAEKLKDKVSEIEEEEIYDEDYEILSSKADDSKYKDEMDEGEELFKRDVRKREESRKLYSFLEDKERTEKPPPSAPRAGSPRPPGGGAPAEAPSATPPPPPPSYAPAGPEKTSIKKMEDDITTISEEPQPTVYEINMGLQYYSVMMEQRSYLIYVYFSHKELKIVDEEGKTIYETTFTIVTTKKEPPVLDLKIKGDEFEVHPIFGKVEVKKDAVNPPVMIFSIMPLKSKKEKKKKKETERRFLNVYIEFEEKVISHTILSIMVQPKYFKLDLGPIHLNLSKRTAAIISFISILIAGISLIYTMFSWDPSSSFVDILSGFSPGMGSIVFFAIFLVTLFKEGVFPLKQKISAFLNFDQAGVIQK
ncbi:MAG: hypothetical protein ACFFC3_05695 [Candidatus Odinarchaeota archaeon]